jgi:hypothetical protein
MRAFIAERFAGAWITFNHGRLLRETTDNMGPGSGQKLVDMQISDRSDRAGRPVAPARQVLQNQRIQTI